MHPREPSSGETENGASEDCLGWFILHNLGAILDRWEKSARNIPVAGGLSEPSLLDSAPTLFVALGKAVQAEGAPQEAQIRALVETHSLQRLEHGYNLTQAVKEYALMRETVLEAWAATHSRAPLMTEVRRFHRILDEAVGLAIAIFTEAQHRTLLALDRISEASLESRDLDELLQRLMHSVLESLPAVNTMALLLREGDELRVRVAEGLGREMEIGFSVPIGEGFAGTIAAQRKPILLQSPSDGVLLRSPHLRAQRVRALYGVPLITDGQLIGVAHIGSLSVSQFKKQDLRILDAVATRATAAIYQQMLRQEADRTASELSAVIESMPDGVVIANRKEVELVNRAAEELLGISSEEQIGEGLDRRLVRLQVRELETEKPLAQSAFEEAFQGRSTLREVIVRRSDGEDRILRYATAPVVVGDSIDLAVAIATDITERKQFERERGDLLAREKQARQKAEKAVRIRDQVLAIVSHDLSNPLSVARMSAEMILDRAKKIEEAKIVRHAETIRRSASRVVHLIRDLVEMADIEAGRFQVDQRPVALRSFLDEVAQSQEPLALERGVLFSVQMNFDVGEEIFIDPNRMLQVFANLFENAFKYAEPGDRITLRAALDGDRLVFEVSDQGPGIPKDELEKIFKPYWTKARKGHRGTGIGLFIAKGIVQAHQGRIRAMSELGRGTTFLISLPHGPPARV